jgi:hypothetical protein
MTTNARPRRRPSMGRPGRAIPGAKRGAPKLSICGEGAEVLPVLPFKRALKLWLPGPVAATSVVPVGSGTDRHDANGPTRGSARAGATFTATRLPGPCGGPSGQGGWWVRFPCFCAISSLQELIRFRVSPAFRRPGFHGTLPATKFGSVCRVSVGSISINCSHPRPGFPDARRPLCRSHRAPGANGDDRPLGAFDARPSERDQASAEATFCVCHSRSCSWRRR